MFVLLLCFRVNFVGVLSLQIFDRVQFVASYRRVGCLVIAFTQAFLFSLHWGMMGKSTLDVKTYLIM